MHWCKPGYDVEKEEYVFQCKDNGPAVVACTEDNEGRLWCGNSEYTTQANFCPFCGYKAPQQVETDDSIIRLEHEGKLTAGYYNDMEAGRPVFIDEISLSDIVKDLLKDRGLDWNFCWWNFGGPEDVKNPLVGKKVRLTLEIEIE